jgi:ribonuclease HI
MTYLLQFDGIMNPPGPSGVSYVLFHQTVLEDGLKVRMELRRGYKYYGFATTREAEYLGLLLGLHHSKDIPIKHIEIETDKGLVLDHITDRIAVQTSYLVPYIREAKNILQNFESYEFHQIPKKENKLAYGLCYQALTTGLEFHRDEIGCLK